MKHKIFRALLSLVLVCVLLISWSPIRARATGAGATAGIITQVLPLAGEGGAVAGGATLGTAAFGYVLAGLGVIATGAVLLALVDRYQEYSGELETAVYYYPDGTWSYGVDMTFVERVHAWLYNDGVIGSNYVYSDASKVTYFHGCSTQYPTYQFRISYLSTSSQIVYHLDCCVIVGSRGYTSNGKTYECGDAYSFKYLVDGVEKTCGIMHVNVESGGVYMGAFTSTSSNSAVEKAVMKMLDQITGGEISTGVTANGDYQLGAVEAYGRLGTADAWNASVYKNWYGNARTYKGDEAGTDVITLPIPLNPSQSDVITGTLTQEEVWAGSVVETQPETVPAVIGLSDIWTLIKSIPQSLADVITGPIIGTLTDIWEYIKSIPGALADVITGPIVGTLTDIWNFIKTIPGSLADVITGPIVGALTNIWDLITSIPQAIAEAISAIFVPEADFITEKWNAIRSRFAFADSIASSGQMILGVLQGIDPEPPVIYVELGDAEGSYYLGGQVAFLDLRWYARYKPTGDAIISAFLWLVFVWRMFIKLPGIIAGLPGDFVMQGVIDLGLADRLPARKKEFENERQENRRFFKK